MSNKNRRFPSLPFISSPFCYSFWKLLIVNHINFFIFQLFSIVGYEKNITFVIIFCPGVIQNHLHACCNVRQLSGWHFDHCDVTCRSSARISCTFKCKRITFCFSPKHVCLGHTPYRLANVCWKACDIIVNKCSHWLVSYHCRVWRFLS